METGGDAEWTYPLASERFQESVESGLRLQTARTGGTWAIPCPAQYASEDTSFFTKTTCRKCGLVQVLEEMAFESFLNQIFESCGSRTLNFSRNRNCHGTVPYPRGARTSHAAPGIRRRALTKPPGPDDEEGIVWGQGHLTQPRKTLKLKVSAAHGQGSLPTWQGPAHDEGSGPVFRNY